MSLFCALFAVACLLAIVFVDDTWHLVNPYLAKLGCLVGVIGMSLALAGCGALGRERQRSADDARDVAQEALCAPLPVCDIPPEANAKQLQAALWSCVLEYRALYSACMHAVRPVGQEIPR